jgi:hypothetical protein
MAGHQTHVDGLIPSARTGHGLETTPIPEARLQHPVRHYVDGRAAYITLSPKQLAGGEHVVPAIARELQDKGEIPPGAIKGVKRVR